MKKLLIPFLLAACLSVAQPAHAEGKWAVILKYATAGLMQISTHTVKADTPFTMTADHNGVDTDGYRVYLDGQLVATQPVSILTPEGTIQYRFEAGVPKGTHVLIYAAFNEFVEAQSEPFTLTAKGGPGKPTNIRIEK